MGADTDDDSFDSPGNDSGEEGGVPAKKKDDRRATASPTTIGALMDDLGIAADDGEVRVGVGRVVLCCVVGGGWHFSVVLS